MKIQHPNDSYNSYKYLIFDQKIDYHSLMQLGEEKKIRLVKCNCQ